MSAVLGTGGLLIAAGSVAGDGPPNVPMSVVGLGIGVAGFVDHGGAWFRGQDRRSGTDAGVGLRIGSIRSAGSIVGRLDLAYRFENDREPGGWVLSLGRGFGWQRF